MRNQYDEGKGNSELLIKTDENTLLPCKAILFIDWKFTVNETIYNNSIASLIGTSIKTAISNSYKPIAFPAIICTKSILSARLKAKSMINALKHELENKRPMILIAKIVVLQSSEFLSDIYKDEVESTSA